MTPKLQAANVSLIQSVNAYATMTTFADNLYTKARALDSKAASRSQTQLQNSLSRNEKCIFPCTRTRLYLDGNEFVV